MNKTIIATAVIGAALALAGCAQAATTTTHPASPKAPISTSQPAPASTQPANPVPIVRATGATVTPGEVYGSTTVQGWLSADGSFASGERVDVYTLPAGITGQQAIAQVGVSSSDSQVLIAGNDFYMFVYPAQNPQTGDNSYPVSPATIAARVHGTVIEPSS